LRPGKRDASRHCWQNISTAKFRWQRWLTNAACRPGIFPAPSESRWAWHPINGCCIGASMWPRRSFAIVECHYRRWRCLRALQIRVTSHACSRVSSALRQEHGVDVSMSDGRQIDVAFIALGTEAMSALGHKRTFAVQNGMSALPPIADMCGATRDVRCQERTSLS